MHVRAARAPRFCGTPGGSSRSKRAHDASTAARCRANLPEGGRTALRRARTGGSQAASLTGLGSAEARRAPADMKRALGSARLGSARLGSARLGSARLGSARLGSARLGSARLGSARLGSARLLIISFAASSGTSAFKDIALPLHRLPARLPPGRARAMRSRARSCRWPRPARGKHVPDRATCARCVSVEGAICRARAMHWPKVNISQIRCIHPIAPTSFEDTSLSNF